MKSYVISRICLLLNHNLIFSGADTEEGNFKERKQKSVKVLTHKISYIALYRVTHIYSIAERLRILGQRPKLAFYSETTEFY